MNIAKLINDWIAASNAFNTKMYLEFYSPDAILDDPSVGKQFKGHKGIKEYFDRYFIGYDTHSKIVKLEILDNEKAHLEVEFTGDFPEGKIGGTFDFTFKNEKIALVKANLLH